MAKKKGKYANVLPGLPRFTNPDPSFKEAVNTVKRMLSEHAQQKGLALTGEYLSKRYIEYRKQKDEFDEKIKKLNVILEVLTQMIIDQYEVEGTTRIILDTGESVGLQDEPYTVIKDKEKVREWVIEANLEEELLTVQWQTLNGIVKKALLDGESLPDGVEVFNKPKAKFYRG